MVLSFILQTITMQKTNARTKGEEKKLAILNFVKFKATTDFNRWSKVYDTNWIVCVLLCAMPCLSRWRVRASVWLQQHSVVCKLRQFAKAIITFVVLCSACHFLQYFSIAFRIDMKRFSAVAIQTTYNIFFVSHVFSYVEIASRTCAIFFFCAQSESERQIVKRRGTKKLL